AASGRVFHNNSAAQPAIDGAISIGTRFMLRFTISNRLGRQNFEHVSGPIEFGRGPERDGIPRCVVNDGYVSKDHVKIEEQPEGRVKIDNLSQRNSIRLPDNTLIDKGDSRSVKLPLRLTVGETFIDIE